ncbi:MAG TPA: fused MFS/spermidine synthase [Gemmatimonadaceae bacterium]|nr:fused MFS/spermidine synthase [Gemmatimonadaceae bacterium]
MRSRGSVQSLRALYAAAVFLGSFLLFLTEPIAGKRLLPLLGGSAAVWTTCLVFFQTALLAGYAGAHLVVTRVPLRRQATLFVALLVLSLVQLAAAIDLGPHASVSHPIASVLWLLTLLIGLPFLVLSATSPLLQAWFARSAAATPDGGSAQPYRLFALSNAGSLIALLIYPLIVEPHMPLSRQRLLLVGGFALFAAVCAAIGFEMRGARDTAGGVAEANVTASDVGDSRPARRDVVLWVALAGCGSLLLSAVTNHLSQNVAAVPLLWIAPLVAYLLSFIVAFAGDHWPPRWLTVALLAVGGVTLGDRLLHTDLTTPLPRTIGLYCAALFALCLFCHGELHRLRPAPRSLTAYYVLIAIGGALGAIAVGVGAPMLLSGNYELSIALALTAALGIAVYWSWGVFGRSIWFAAAAAAITVVYRQMRDDRVNRVMQLRDFYGTLQVTQTVDARQVAMRTLYHGTIEHGNQIYRTDLHDEPTTYYSRASGVGLALSLCCGDRPRRVGVIGLGTGTIATYGRTGDLFRFYEIDPHVERIARSLFTYLHDSPATIEVVPGDARISMEREPSQRYDVIAVDAFSGDAIPVHLLTRQALALYRRELAPNGILAVHVSNRYLDLAPVVRQEADAARLRSTLISAPLDTVRDGYASDWVLVSANGAFMENPIVRGASDTIPVPHGLRLWTDDYNSLLPILRRKTPED